MSQTQVEKDFDIKTSMEDIIDIYILISPFFFNCIL